MVMSFRQFLLEGGNIKVGEVGADPIDVTKRSRADTQSDIHHALSAIHDAFHSEHGEHLFGEKKKALHNGSAYSGSTRALFDKQISDKEYSHYKPKTGDADIQIPHEHMPKIESTLKPGRHFGTYEVVGTKKHGKEITALMRHIGTKRVHQFDFEGSKYENSEPSKNDQFLHSSDWGDTKIGVKGAHHKILINATGGAIHKFSITHGLKSREDKSKDVGETHPDKIAHRLFGKDADTSHMHSFRGIVHLIKNHITKDRHQEIYDKFKADVAKQPFDSKAALRHMQNQLSVKDSVTEETEEVHHTTVIPLVGFAPFSHMGHAKDLGGEMKKLPGSKHIGFKDSKDGPFDFNERSNILKKQWQGEGVDVKVHKVEGAGATIAQAHDSLPKNGKKVLHLLVGADRKSFAEGLKRSMIAGKLKEMAGKNFDEVHVHITEDEDRKHGMSGTKMRKAASAKDIETFHRHLGNMFSRKEAEHMMNRVHDGIKTGAIPLERK